MNRSRLYFAGLVAVLLLTLLADRFGVVATATKRFSPDPACATCEPQARELQSAPDSAEAALAEKHAPVVYLKRQARRCDTNGEAFLPTAVDIVLDNDRVRLIDDEGTPVASAPGIADIAGRGEGYSLDFPGDPQRPGCRYETDFRALDPAPEPLVYARVSREEDHTELALQYWFFYYFNDFNNTHEGDWEFIQLTFEAETAEAALGLAPARVVYSQHAGGETADWGSKKLSREGDRPIVYVARGSHANQYQQKNHLGKGENGSGFGCDDATGPSVRVSPQVVVLPADVPTEGEFAWLSFQGHWGQLKRGYFDGPTGPAQKRAWTNPIGWMEDQRDSSIEVPEQTIGPSAADAFCDVVAWASSQLFQRGPYVFLAMIGGTVAAIGFTSTRTRFRPVLASPLRLSRHLGQILRAAFSIERRHWRLFLGIGALFIPIGLLTGGLQALVMTATPVESLVEVADEPGINISLALVLGVLQFGLAYWLVINATIAALHALDSGREPSISEAYHAVLVRLRDLVLARYAKVAAIALLSLSIFGLPLALYLAVRWIFVEHVVLIEGASYHGSGGESARVVSASPLKAVGGAIVILIVGAGAAPFVGGVLVLLTPWSLTFLNLLTAGLYVALIPFVGIGLTLLYYDLRLKLEQRR